MTPAISCLKHGEKCLCTLCNCGKHHCPPKRDNLHYSPDLQTSYANQFFWKKSNGPPKSYKPLRQYTQTKSDPEVFVTVKQETYSPRPNTAPPPAPFRPAATTQLSGSFRSETTARVRYDATKWHCAVCGQCESNLC
jgi:hypothetical protein